MQLLESLQLKTKNSGASGSGDWWSNHTKDGEIISINPSDGKAIGSVYRASAEDYESLIQKAAKAF